jgi:hypothetical protein
MNPSSSGCSRARYDEESAAVSSSCDARVFVGTERLCRRERAWMRAKSDEASSVHARDVTENHRVRVETLS